MSGWDDGGREGGEIIIVFFWGGGGGALMKFLLWSVGRYVVLYIWRAVLCCAFFWRGFCAVHYLACSDVLCICFGVHYCVVHLFGV